MDYDVENARAMLRQSSAEFVENAESRSVPIENRKEVQIGWVVGNTDNFGGMQEFLREYTWPENETAKRWVENPQVRGGVLPGVWRQAFVTQLHRRNRDRNTQELLVVMTLRRGWAEAIDWTESLAMEWRERDGNGVAVPGVTDTTSIDKASTVVVRFPNIAPEKVQACLGELSASTFETPKIQGFDSTLTWYKAFAIANKTDDGTLAIDLTLTRSRFTIAGYQQTGTPRGQDTYRVYDVPRATAHLIVNSWKATGRSADVQLNQDRDLCVVSLWGSVDEVDDEFTTLTGTSCAFYVTRTVYTNAEEPVDIPENAMGITYTGSFNLDQNTGLYSGWIEKRVRQTLHIPSHRSRNTHGHTVMTERWDGLYLDAGVYKEASLSKNGSDITTTLSGAIELPSNALLAGETWDVSKSRNEDCTYNIQVAEREEIAGETAPYDTLDHAFQSDSAKDRFNQLAAAITLTAAAGEVLRASVSYNKETGLVDVSEVTMESKAVEDAAKEKTISAFEVSERDTDRNQTAPIAQELTQTAGKLVTTAATLNEFGRYDNTEQERTATERQDAGADKRIEAFQTQEGAQERHLAVEPTLPSTQTAGVIQSLSKRLNDFLRWDKEETTMTATERAEAGHTREHQAFETADVEEGQNVVVEPTMPTAQTPGAIRRLRKRLNAFLRWDVEDQTRTAVEQADSTKGVTRQTFEVAEDSGDTNLIVEPTLPDTTVSGKITTLRKRLNAFLRWDKEEQTRTSNEVSDAQKADSDNTFETTARDTVRNKATAGRTPTSAAGVIQNVTLEKSEFPDRIHDTLESRTAKTVADAVTADSSTTFESQDSDTIRNAAAARIVNNESEAGKIRNQRVEKSEFPDRVHDTIETRESVVVADAQKVDTDNTFETVARDTVRNKATAGRTATSAGGVIQSVTLEKSEFPDRIHDTLEARTAKTVPDAQKANTDNTFETVARDTIRNKAGAARTAASAGGVIQEVTAEKSEFPDRVHDTLNQRTAKTVADFQKAKSDTTFDTTESDTIRNKAGAARVPASANGAIETVREEKSEFPDRIHDTKEKRTAKTVADANKTETQTKFEKQDADTIRNAVTPRVVAVEAGKIKTQRVEKSEFPDRVHDSVEERQAIAVSNTIKVKQIDAFHSLSSETDRNQEIPVVEESTQTAGKIKQTRSQLNDFDRYDNTEEERSAITQEDTGGTATATTFETQDGDSARNLEAEPMPEATEGGKIKAFRKSLNEYRRWDKEGTERTANEVADAQKEDTKSEFEDVESDTIRNKASAARTAVNTTGEIQTVRTEKSEFPDRIHDTLTRRIAKTVLGFLKGYLDTSALYTETTGDRNADAAEASVSVDTAAGKITEVSSEKNQYGKFDTRKVERTAKNQTATDTAENHLSSTQTEKETQAASAATRNATTGERVTVQNDETEFGKHRTAVQVETANELTTEDRRISGLSDTKIDQTINGEQKTVPVRVNGQVVQLTQRPSPFKDKWDSTVTVDDGTPYDSGWVAYPDFWGNSYFRTFRHQATVPTDGFLAEHNNSLSFQKNEHGWFDGTATMTRTRRTGSGWDMWPMDERTYPVYEIATRSVWIKAAVVVPSGTAEAVYTEQQRIFTYQMRENLENTYTGAINYIQAQGNDAGVNLVSHNMSTVTLRTGEQRYKAQCKVFVSVGAWTNI